ncbi:MAG TPA: MmcQ/YjbR family DNA-binding protein [Candidatus Dormibacteraeota bacterium]|nr:MmcQ/YjbR family DNA-binding protein [Candidatus Dormibacteraeota bacterium]
MTFYEFRRLCLAEPEAVELETWGEATFRVGGRIFAMGAPEGKSISLKASLADQSGLVAMDPRTFSVAAYTGRFGWVNVRLSRLSADLGARLVRNAWERTAPRRLTRAVSSTKTPADVPSRRRRAGAQPAAKAPRR